MKKLPDEYFEDEFPHYPGKKPAQKLKPYVVLQYLLKNTDENNLIQAPEIVDYLKRECHIYAERRSIYRDIDEINLVSLMLRDGYTIDEAADILENDKDDENKLVKYDKSRKGFYVQSNFRQFSFDDMLLLAECVYSSKFIEEIKANRLVKYVICEFVSTHQAEIIKQEITLIDRDRTNNKEVLRNIAEINKAMSRKLNGIARKPTKIKFQYIKHSIDNVRMKIERRHGDFYTVSPFQLIINDGNYYLLAYNEERKDILTYRVDRMKNVQVTEEPREGDEAFSKIDARTFIRRTISMFDGRTELVKIRFINSLLDTAIDQFGTKNVSYKRLDDKHFTMTASIDISEHFFGWLLRFGTKVKILSPDAVSKEFSDYLKKVRWMYTHPADV